MLLRFLKVLGAIIGRISDKYCVCSVKADPHLRVCLYKKSRSCITAGKERSVNYTDGEILGAFCMAVECRNCQGDLAGSNADYDGSIFDSQNGII